jgi:flagellar biosynthesis/type III secretory pathway protein FliH
VFRLARRADIPCTLPRPRTPAEAQRESESVRHRDALARARDEGRVEGRREAEAALAAQVAEVTGWLGQQAETVAAERTRFLSVAEREVVSLALILAGKILGRRVADPTELAVEPLRRVLFEVADRERVAIRVSPDALAAYRELADGFNQQVASPDGIRWIPDRRVPHWGFVVETEAGKLDGRIETQLEEAAALFDEVWRGRDV